MSLLEIIIIGYLANVSLYVCLAIVHTILTAVQAKLNPKLAFHVLYMKDQIDRIKQKSERLENKPYPESFKAMIFPFAIGVIVLKTVWAIIKYSPLGALMVEMQKQEDLIDELLEKEGKN